MAQEHRHFEHLDPNAVNPSPMLFEQGFTHCLAAVILGGIGVVLGWGMNPAQFYVSYLSSWAFAWSIAVGVLFLVMLHYIVDAGWDTVVRRPAEQLLSTMPLILLGLLPILIGMNFASLYPWVHATPPLEGFKGVFLSRPVVLAFLAGDAAIWLGLAWLFRRNSIRQDTDGAAHWTISSRRWSAAGMVLNGLAVAACSLHLIMSLDYHWASTVFSVYIWAGGVLGALALLTLIALALRRGPLREYLSSDTIHDLGKLTFAFSCFWGYIAFSQYFLIWYGNLPEETAWFLRRWTGATESGGAWWWTFAVLLMLGEFIIPFVVLMSANMKRNRRVLGSVCAIILLGHWADLYWLIQPERSPMAPPLAWLWIDLSIVLLLGGLGGLLFIRSLRRAALFPLMDPRLVEALSQEHVEEIEQADVE